ncbi:hypothetical protein CCACVL1_07781, partial [Corchorus capsularis]
KEVGTWAEMREGVRSLSRLPLFLFSVFLPLDIPALFSTFVLLNFSLDISVSLRYFSPQNPR